MNGETAFRFVGEQLALDLVNTATATPAGSTSDAIPTYRAAVAWLLAAGVLTPRDERTLLAFDGSAEATDALAALRAFRSHVRAMLDAHRASGEFGESFVHGINRQLELCGCARQLVRDGNGFALRVRYRFERPIGLLMPLANAAADLLVRADRTRLKRCRSESCDTYFLDTSRNCTRTWCDMGSCGNRAKAARYYRRTRARERAHSPNRRTVRTALGKGD
jgi:predicted RNA-binding Zn ribbon-like protein